jgi:DinB superfamily
MSKSPDASEYAPYYAKYVALVPEGDIAETLARQIDETLVVYRDISDDQAKFRYEPGKWSVKAMLGHVSDSERVFQYRALSIARGERQSLPGFDQDDYAREAGSDERPWSGLVEELKAVRAASVALFRSLADEALDRRGIANNVEVSVRALGYIIAGHERHHLNILRERYLGASAYPVKRIG